MLHSLEDASQMQIGMLLSLLILCTHCGLKDHLMLCFQQVQPPEQMQGQVCGLDSTHPASHEWEKGQEVGTDIKQQFLIDQQEH